MGQQRVRIRLHIDIQDAIDREAAWQGVKIGTLTNRIVREELAKIEAVGPDNCLICGSREYTQRAAEWQSRPAAFYLLPDFALRERYTPTNGRGIDSGAQVTLYLTPAQVGILHALAAREMLRGTWKRGADGAVEITSYRYVLVGLLLNHPLLAELTETRK